MRLILKIFIFFSIIGLGVAYYFFSKADELVATRLMQTQTQNIPSLLSTPTVIKSEHKIKKKVLLEVLKNRNYIKKNIAISNLRPGEFIASENEIVIFNRGFNSKNGKDITASLKTISLTTKKITDSSDSLSSIVFEPISLSPLVDKEFKVFENKDFKELPTNFVNALVAIEDERFFHHFGIDLKGIFRALIINIKAGRVIQGGSTITQQLAKNILFSPERTLIRKLKEAFAALSLERRLSKNQIIEMYLNEIYFGQEGSIAIHGIGEAAKTFFKLEATELSLSQSALLAGIIKAPSSYSPRRHIEKAIKRRDLVLQNMLSQNLITKQEFDQAKIEEIIVNKTKRHKNKAPHFLYRIKDDLEQKIENLDSVLNKGINVHSTINFEMQQCAENAISKHITYLENGFPKLKNSKTPIQAALVAIEPFSGEVRAWVGGRDYQKSQFDHVYQLNRPVGSTIKPFVYLTALDEKLNSYKVATVSTILPDAPIEVILANGDVWEPQNFSKEYQGPVTLRKALEKSLNIPAVYLAQKAGIKAVANTIKSFDISKKVPAVPSIALGAIDTNLLKITAAYSGLANNGILVKPRLYSSVISNTNQSLLETKIEEKKLADENAVYVLTNLLEGVINSGTARVIRSLGYKGDAAGKTGTSNESRDSWFIGYTPNMTAGIWVGFSDNSETFLTGSKAAAPIWSYFMMCAQNFLEKEKFIKTSNVEYVRIDADTGIRDTAECPAANPITEIFIKGTGKFNECNRFESNIEDDQFIENEQKPDENTPRSRKGLWDILFH